MDVKTLILTTFEKTKLNMLELELILAYVLKKSREFLFSHPEYELTKKQISNFQLLISKRLAGWPVAYLTGHKEFYGLDFFVNQNVLIPEPETELMIDEAIKLVSHIAYRKSPKIKSPLDKGGLGDFYNDKNKLTIIDVGTGSGCIIISLLKQLLNYQLSITNYQFFAIDISKKALTVARKNAKLHKVNNKIKFLHGNLLEPILKSKILNPKSKILILANLPYLTTKQIKNSPTIQKEPRLALSAGADGLKYYRKLFKQIKKISDMRYAIQDTRYVLCEIDPSQTQKIKTLIKNELPTATYEIKKDLCGHNRLVIINLKRK